MKTIWETRRSEEAVTPVIATILLVAITVVLAAVLWAMLGMWIKPGDEPVFLAFERDSTASNWTVSILEVQGTQPLLEDVKITVMLGDATVALSTRALAELSPGTYYNGVRFQDVTEKGYLSVGDMITFDKDIYDSQSKVMFSNLGGTKSYGQTEIG